MTPNLQLSGSLYFCWQMASLSFWCYVGVQNFISQMRSYQQENNLTNTVIVVHFISLCHINYSTFDFKSSGRSPSSLCINFFHLLAPKPNLEKYLFIQTNSFIFFTCPKSSFTCPRLWASGLARRLSHLQKLAAKLSVI